MGSWLYGDLLGKRRGSSSKPFTSSGSMSHVAGTDGNLPIRFRYAPLAWMREELARPPLVRRADCRPRSGVPLLSFVRWLSLGWFYLLTPRLPKARPASNSSPYWKSRQMDSDNFRPPAARALALFPMRFSLVRIQLPTARPAPRFDRRHPIAAWVIAQRRCGLPSRVMPPCFVIPLGG